MSIEQRISTLEEVSHLLISASRRLHESVKRLQASLREAERRLEQDMREVSEALQRSEEAMEALMAFVPITQAEIVRLDHRIDVIEGA